MDDHEDQERTRRIYESFLREDVGSSSAAAIRRNVVEMDIDVSLHATVEAAIDDDTWGETVTRAAVVPIEYELPVTTHALGDLADTLKNAVGDGKPRRIVGKLSVGDGGHDFVAIHSIYATDVREE